MRDYAVRLRVSGSLAVKNVVIVRCDLLDRSIAGLGDDCFGRWGV